MDFRALEYSIQVIDFVDDDGTGNGVEIVPLTRTFQEFTDIINQDEMLSRIQKKTNCASALLG